jgi:hypothetical protein
LVLDHSSGERAGEQKFAKLASPTPSHTALVKAAGDAVP